MSTLRFVLYSLAIIGSLLLIGHCISIEPVTITSLPNTLICESDPFIDSYICYQP